MKYKGIMLTITATIIYSCASKPSVPTKEVNEAKLAAELKAKAAAELAEGKALYENNCAKCHKLYEPKSFSAADWKPIVTKMQRKAMLDDLQGQKIYNYVTMN